MIPVRQRITKKVKPSSAERREGNCKKHLALIRRLPCCITGKKAPSDPHHLREGLAHERGIGRKATDRWTVPVSRGIHEDLHKVGSRQEWEWFRKHGIEDPLELAAALWRNTGDLERMQRVLAAHMGK